MTTTSIGKTATTPIVGMPVMVICTGKTALAETAGKTGMEPPTRRTAITSVAMPA
jgi:hypothetical protein